MAGIVIDFPVIQQFDELDKKLQQADDSFSKASKSLGNLGKGGLKNGIGSLSGGAMDIGMLFKSASKVLLGVAAVGYAADKLVKASNASTVAQYSAGASGEQLGYMNTAGKAVGMDAGGMAGMANALGDKLREGGYASAFFRQAGIVDFGPHTRNKMDNLIKAIDLLRKTQDKDMRMYLAREMGLAGAAPMLEMSDTGYEIVKSASKYNALGEDQKKNLADLSGQIGAIQEGIVASGQKALSWIYEKGFKTSLWGGGTGMPGDRTPRKSSSEDAIRENTDAIRENTRAARNERIHMGRRTMAAVPKAWTAQAAEAAMRDQARRLGGI